MHILTSHALGEVSGIQKVKRVPHVLYTGRAGRQSIEGNDIDRRGFADGLR